MAQTALQGADLDSLHAAALRLRDAARVAFANPEPAADPVTRARHELARLDAATQLNEMISWLLVRHAGRALPLRWHVGSTRSAYGLTGERAIVAAAINRLYARIIAIDAGPTP